MGLRMVRYHRFYYKKQIASLFKNTRQREDSNLHRGFPLHSPSKRASYQLEYTAILTPYTGIEPASPYGPTVFKTAPSPPGHTAYKGDEDRTHTYGIKTRCAAITLHPIII